MGAFVVTGPMVQAKVGKTFVHLVEGQPVPAEVDPVQLEQMLAAGQVAEVKVEAPAADAEQPETPEGAAEQPETPEAKPARGRRS